MEAFTRNQFGVMREVKENKLSIIDNKRCTIKNSSKVITVRGTEEQYVLVISNGRV